MAGVGLPGASEVEQASWIEVKTLSNPTALAQNRQKFSLGLGELSSILLAQELGADIILLDDFNARRLARSVGLEVRGSVGLLEIAYTRGYVADLRAVFQQLLENSAYVDRRLLNQRLGFLGLRPL